MILFTPHTQKGFTLVETLVAIAILSLSILSTFTAVQNSLHSSAFAQDQITAFYLTQEAIEYIRNQRDTNTLQSIASVSTGGPGVPWLNTLSVSSSDACYFGHTCVIDSLHPNGQPATQLCVIAGGFGSCPYLRQDTVTGLYGYTSSWPLSRFKREVQFTQNSANEVVVTVQIYWIDGLIPHAFQVSQLLLRGQ